MGNMGKPPPNWEAEWKRHAKRDTGIGLVGLAARMMGINLLRGVTASLARKQSELLKIPKNISRIYYDAITAKLEELNMTAEAFNQMESASQKLHLLTMDARAKREIEKSYFHEYRDILGSEGNDQLVQEMIVAFLNIVKRNNRSKVDYFHIFCNIEAAIVNETFYTHEQIQDMLR